MATKKEMEQMVDDICDAVNSVGYMTLKGWNKTVQLIAEDLKAGWCLQIGADGKVAKCEEAIKEAESDHVVTFQSDTFKKLMDGEINAKLFVGAHWKAREGHTWLDAVITKGSSPELIWFLDTVVG